MIPKDFPAWQTVYDHYRNGLLRGTWGKAFAWLGNFRRLSKDFEILTERAENNYWNCDD